MQKGRFLKIAGSILLFLFLFHQIYASVYSPLTTETCDYVEETDGIGFTGIIIRNEIPVKKSDHGVLHFRVEDGERVSKNGVLADVYDSEKDSATVSRIENVKRKIANIETLENFNDSAAVDFNLLNTRIFDKLGELSYSKSTGDFSEIGEIGDSLLMMMNRKEMVIGSSGNFSGQIADLKSELASLENGLSNPSGQITSPESGFFVSAVDGFETVINANDLSVFTPEYMDTLTARESDVQGCVGKIVSDYTWYIAAPITAQQSLSYREGDTATVRTTLKSNPILQVTVKQINISHDDGKAVVLLACQEMNAELAAMRTAAMTLVEGEYSGLRVSKSALRVYDGKTGVYVVSGMELKFVAVDVLHDAGDYVICQKEAYNDRSVLRIYDKIVTKGKNLYDGKIIN